MPVSLEADEGPIRILLVDPHLRLDVAHGAQGLPQELHAGLQVQVVVDRVVEIEVRDAPRDRVRLA